MWWRRGTLVGVILLAAGPALAQTNAAPASKSAKFNLQGEARLVFGAKFTDGGAPAAAPGKAVGPGAGYAAVRYVVGEGYDRDDIRQILRYLSQALPAKFGNTSGTYTITITIRNLAGHTLIKEPIISFQWAKERGLFFIDKIVEDVQKTSWSGTLVNQIPIKQSNRRLRMEVEAFYHQDRSLDFEMLKKTAKLFSTGALASVISLPTAALPILDSVADLVNSFYAGSKKQTLIETEEIVLGSTDSKTADVVFNGEGGGSVTLPITVTLNGTQTRLAAELVGGKFDPAQLSEAVFSTTEIDLADKTVSVIELISTSENKQFRGTRALLDPLLAGGSYGKDPSNKKEEDLGTRCGDLYAAFHAYLSSFDARAMFWAFLRKYGDRMDRAKCLGHRGSELAAVGLKM